MPPPEDFLDWPDSPFRRVTWRFNRATLLAKTGGRTDPSRDDKLIKQASKYLQRRNLAATAGQLLAARKSAPGIHGAVELAHGPPRVILELRGRILARQSAAEIATRMGLMESEVEAYAALFFDVASRLVAGDYIFWHVIGISPTNSPSLEQRVLMAAWGHGPLVLESALGFYDRQNDPSLPQPEPGSDAWHSDRAIELAMAVDRIPTDMSTKAGSDFIRALPAIFEMIDRRIKPLTLGERLTRRARTYWAAQAGMPPDLAEETFPNRPTADDPASITNEGQTGSECEFIFPDEDVA